MNHFFLHVNGVNCNTTDDSIRYYFSNTKRDGVGDVYFVDRLGSTYCDIFFSTDEESLDIENSYFCIDDTSITVVEYGPSFTDRLLVQNLNSLTTRDGLKCFIKAHTGLDVQSIDINTSDGQAILRFGQEIDFPILECSCKENQLDNNYLNIKPMKSSNCISVNGYDNECTDDLFFYFDNTRQSGGEDVESIWKKNDGSHLVLFQSSECVIDVCKRKHSLKDKPLTVQVHYRCLNRADNAEPLTTGAIQSSKFESCTFQYWNSLRRQPDDKALTHVMSKEENNFLRCYQLCFIKATKSVRMYFSRTVPDSTLSAYLNAYKDMIKLKYCNCSNEELSLLYPASSRSVVSSDIDFTLLYTLISKTFVTSPTRGWGSLPLPGDTTQEDDIERIRFYRNSLAHNTELMLHDFDFNSIWTDASQAILRLGSLTLMEDITNLFTPQLDKESKEQILKTMEDDRKFFYEIQQESIKSIGLRINDNLSVLSSSFSCVPTLKEIHSFNVPSGELVREIRDLSAMPNGGWIISDYNNSELIINYKSGVLFFLKELSKPMFVTCLSENVAVSGMNERRIMLFDIKTWTVKKEIHTTESVLGMTESCKDILFRAGNEGCRVIASNGPGQLIPISGDNMPYIAVWKNKIFLSNWKMHKIYCYKTTGELHWDFSDDKMRNPNGISTDKEGNVFIVGTYSHNILIISKNYKENKEHKFVEAGMKYPIAIDYDKRSGKIIVCNMKGTVKIFDIITAGT